MASTGSTPPSPTLSRSKLFPLAGSRSKLFAHGPPRRNGQPGGDIYVIPPIETISTEEWQALLGCQMDYPPHPDMNAYYGMKTAHPHVPYTSGYFLWSHEFGLWTALDKDILGLAEYRVQRNLVEQMRKMAGLRPPRRLGPKEYVKRTVGVEVRRERGGVGRRRRKRKGTVVAIAAERAEVPLWYIKWVMETIG